MTTRIDAHLFRGEDSFVQALILDPVMLAAMLGYLVIGFATSALMQIKTELKTHVIYLICIPSLFGFYFVSFTLLAFMLAAD